MKHGTHPFNYNVLICVKRTRKASATFSNTAQSIVD